MEIGGRHIKRTRTEIEKEDRIVIKTEVVDEMYDQNKVICGSYIQYKDIDPGNFVIKEEPQNESVGFVAQIKTEDCLNLPHEFANEPQAGSSSLKAPEIVYLKTERITPSTSQTSLPTSIAYLPSQPLDKGSQISVEEKNILSPKGIKICQSFQQNCGTVSYTKEKVDVVYRCMRSNDKLLDRLVQGENVSSDYCSDSVGVDDIDVNSLNIVVRASRLKTSKRKSINQCRMRVEALIPKDMRFPIGDYRCYSCDQNFNLLSDWEDHMVQYLSSEGCFPVQSKSNYTIIRKSSYENIISCNGVYKCHICSFENKTKYATVTHILKVHSNVSLKCAFCTCTFFVCKHLRKHLFICHNPLQAKYKCHDCSYESTLKQSLKRHAELKHKALMMKCDLCPTVCGNMENLRRHILCFHSETKRKIFKCSDCSYTNTNQHSFQVHIVRQHGNNIKYSCHYCEYKTLIKSHLINHIFNRHMERPPVKKKFVCDRCERRFKAEANLRVHVKKIHSSKEEIYKCSYCPVQFKTKHDCFIHMNVEHLSTFIYNCNSCKFVGTNREDFIQHITKRHAVTYYCAHCPVTKEVKNKLVRHVNLKHNIGEKYKCPKCKYIAKTKCLFNQHMNVKHNPNPVMFVCHHCGHRNKIKHKLYQHIQTKHKKLFKTK